jgi:hypothetical protein
MALQLGPIRMASFDIERRLGRIDGRKFADERHVFIAGLARAGTTVLVRLLDEVGRFAAQSYRDMPFVLAPGLWRRISSRHRLQSVLAERAHADGVATSFDSVEAFEEVFWRTCAEDLYVRKAYLKAHEVGHELAADLQDYVAAVIVADGRPGVARYLSKNNNNVLRLRGIAEAFPNAILVVPFRHPHQQAASLLRQHELFSETQRLDPFVRRYMGWLGHHEFGLDYRPFAFTEDAHPASAHAPHELDHWLASWSRVYKGILDTAPAGTVFWDYDDFCARPERAVAALADRIDVPELTSVPSLARIRAPAAYQPHRGADEAVETEARRVHACLVDRARAR